MRALDLCAVCELPRFCHDWRIFHKRTSGMPFREPFPFSPELWLRKRYREVIERRTGHE